MADQPTNDAQANKPEDDLQFLLKRCVNTLTKDSPIRAEIKKFERDMPENISAKEQIASLCKIISKNVNESTKQNDLEVLQSFVKKIQRTVEPQIGKSENLQKLSRQLRDAKDFSNEKMNQDQEHAQMKALEPVKPNQEPVSSFVKPANVSSITIENLYDKLSQLNKEAPPKENMSVDVDSLLGQKKGVLFANDSARAQQTAELKAQKSASVSLTTPTENVESAPTAPQRQKNG